MESKTKSYIVKHIVLNYTNWFKKDYYNLSKVGKLKIILPNPLDAIEKAKQYKIDTHANYIDFLKGIIDNGRNEFLVVDTIYKNKGNKVRRYYLGDTKSYNVFALPSEKYQLTTKMQISIALLLTQLFPFNKDTFIPPTMGY